jgi:hypothetical protein
MWRDALPVISSGAPAMPPGFRARTKNLSGTSNSGDWISQEIVRETFRAEEKISKSGVDRFDQTYYHFGHEGTVRLTASKASLSPAFPLLKHRALRPSPPKTGAREYRGLHICPSPPRDGSEFWRREDSERQMLHR